MLVLRNFIFSAFQAVSLRGLVLGSISCHQGLPLLKYNTLDYNWANYILSSSCRPNLMFIQPAPTDFVLAS